MANLIQLVRRARLGVDAILPGGTASSQWHSDELVDIVNEVIDDLWMAVRQVRKKWGLQTITQTDPAFTRDGETYTPGTSLRVASQATSVALPPDFAEVARVICVSNRTVRFIPASFESLYWTDLEQNSYDDDGNTLTSSASGRTIYYDLIGPRTLALNPPLPESLDLQIDYVPMKRPLYYSNAGTVSVTNGSTGVVGTSTTWRTDNVFAAVDGQAAELIVGLNTLASTSLRLDVDYPSVASIEGNTALTLTAAYGGTTAAGQSAIVAMVPALPRQWHRWIGQMASAYMLRKINPDLAEKTMTDTRRRFLELIRPAAGTRQTQESTITDDAGEFGGLG